MSGSKSKNKGARGEREWAAYLAEHFRCVEAHRGRQYSGGPDSPDVACGIPGTHCEVKRTERLRLYEAMQQAVVDAGEAVPYVAHRANNEDWLVIVRASDLARLAELVYLQLAADPPSTVTFPYVDVNEK